MSTPASSKARRGGRPCVAPGRRQDRFITVRFSNDDEPKARATAKAAGLALPVLMRKLALEAKIVPTVPAIHHDCIDQLRRIGNNLNQALLFAYRGGGASDLRASIFEMLRLCREIRASLLGLPLECPDDASLTELNE